MKERELERSMRVRNADERWSKYKKQVNKMEGMWRKLWKSEWEKKRFKREREKKKDRAGGRNLKY